jgi:putative tricarboxylic transport membrane protein
VVISGNLTGNDPLKGWMAGFAGLFIAGIGQDGLYAYDRYTFGFSDLSGGISLVPALVGAFGFAEVLTVMKDRPPALVITRSIPSSRRLPTCSNTGAR